MNRREVIKAGVVGVSMAAANLINEHRIYLGNVKSIDKRLSGKINLKELQDGEFGYMHNAINRYSRRDKIMYFCLVDDSYNMVRSEPNDIGCVNTQIFRKGDFYMVKPFYKNSDCVDIFAFTPAQLAYYKAYPLDMIEQKSNFYLVPRQWSVCREHYLVKKNLIEFDKGIKLIKDLYENGLPLPFTGLNANYNDISPNVTI